MPRRQKDKIGSYMLQFMLNTNNFPEQHMNCECTKTRFKYLRSRLLWVNVFSSTSMNCNRLSDGKPTQQKESHISIPYHSKRNATVWNADNAGIYNGHTCYIYPYIYIYKYWTLSESWAVFAHGLTCTHRFERAAWAMIALTGKPYYI